MEKYNVVVIDDNKLFCELIELEISRTDDMRLVGVAHNATDGIELIKTKLPDFLILDNIMTSLDGIGVLEILNKLNLIKRPKILMISSLASDDVIRNADKNGADYFLNRATPISLMLERGRMILKSYVRKPVNLEDGFDEGPVKNLDRQQFVTNILHKLGIPANLKGYEYLRRAVLIAIDDQSALSGVTKVIYPKIANEYNTDSSNVERAIRHAIKVSWERCDARIFMEFFRPIMDKKKCRPTNSEVIATLSQYVLTYA